MAKQNKELVIFGCGGHARTVLDVILDNDPGAELIFVDDRARRDETIHIKNPPRIFQVIPEIKMTDDQEYFIALGNNQRRQEMRETLGNIALAKVIAKDALIGTDAQIEDGSFIGHRAIIGPFARVGEGTIINTRSHISHEVEIGRYSQLALDVTVGGRTKIGDNVFIGMRACIFDGLEISSDTNIGANSLVNKSIKAAGTYLGTPARLSR